LELTSNFQKITNNYDLSKKELHFKTQDLHKMKIRNTNLKKENEKMKSEYVKIFNASLKEKKRKSEEEKKVMKGFFNFNFFLILNF
jgi:hypothetical protein